MSTETPMKLENLEKNESTLELVNTMTPPQEEATSESEAASEKQPMLQRKGFKKEGRYCWGGLSKWGLFWLLFVEQVACDG